jgi:hypothetical protein
MGGLAATTLVVMSVTVIVLVVEGPELARQMVCNDVEAWADVSHDEWTTTGCEVTAHYLEQPEVAEQIAAEPQSIHELFRRRK